jgi:hypothetical protein
MRKYSKNTKTKENLNILRGETDPLLIVVEGLSVNIKHSELGFGLTEVILASGLAAVLLAALSMGLRNSQSAARKINTDLDIVTVKGLIIQSVDCRQSFPSPGNPPCTIGSNVELKRKDGAAIINVDESSIFTPWRVRARCTANGIRVSIANNRADEMNPNLIRDYNHPKASLFEAGAPGLCLDRYAAAVGAVTCAPGYIMRGVNFETQQPFCDPLSSIVPACGAGQVLTFNGTSFACVADRVRSDAEIVNIIDSVINSSLGRTSDYQRVIGSSDSECASLSRMKCPDGYFAFAYEARMSPSQNCSLQCRKF